MRAGQVETGWTGRTAGPTSLDRLTVAHMAAAADHRARSTLSLLPTLKVYDEDRSCRRQLNTDHGAPVASSDHRRSVSDLSRRRPGGP
jgi:hypothetical protein